MAEGWSATVANSVLDTYLAAYPWAKMHTAAPGASGTANAATNTTRKQVTWAPAADGVSSNSQIIEWTNVPASEDYTHVSLWSAENGGTFGLSGTSTAPAVTAGNTFRIAVGDLVVTLTVAS